MTLAEAPRRGVRIPTWAKIGIGIGSLAAVSIGSIIVFKVYFESMQISLGSQRVVLGNGRYVENQTINYWGAGREAVPEQRPRQGDTEEIVENGGFENGVEGWGTGFYESLFTPRGVIGLRFSGAVASWALDSLAHKGHSSLRVEHKSNYQEHKFSSFSQRIKVAPWHRYEVTFWAYLKESDKGSFALRVIPSRLSTEAEWERYKRKLDPAITSEWQVRTKEFESGAERFWDLRFTADTPVTVWVDDVVVKDLGAANPQDQRR